LSTLFSKKISIFQVFFERNIERMRVTVPVSGYFKTSVNPAILESPVNPGILGILPAKTQKK